MLSADAMEVLVAMMALLVVGLAALPAWPYSVKWGYYPTGVCGLVVLTLAALAFIGRL